MTSLADDDVSNHLLIKKDISIRFHEAAETLKRFEVKINGKRIKVSLANKQETNGLETHRWILHDEIRIFSDDAIILRIKRGKKRRCFGGRGDKFEEIALSQKGIADEINEQGQAISLVRQHCTVTLEVSRNDVTNMNSSIPAEDLDGLLPERIEELISSSDAFSENVKELRSVLEGIPLPEDAWNILEDTIKTLGKAHPFAKAVLTALSIPYNFLKNERDFKDNMKNLADVMHFTCKCLVDVRYHTRITSARDTVVSMIKVLRDTAVYINDFTSKGKFDQVFAAQFPAKLEEYAEDLVTLKNDFQMAMIMQVARDADKIVSMSSDDFLKKRLGPVGAEELRLGDSCMEGTRVNILREVRTWLQDGESKNILWLVGAPGAGKSTISTTIAKKPADMVPFCAKFFCKRDVEGLRDPHRVWRTIAYGLASKHDGVKAALMRTLEEKKVDPQDYTVIDQFEELIKGPLETDMGETRFRRHRVPYPLIIIDALDECYSAKTEDRDSLLESLALWARLPCLFKLMITSRDVHDIREALGPISHRIDLSTGDNVSDESKRDVSTFFTQKFMSMRKGHVVLRSRSDWPGTQQLQEMTDYAAGLFIWADMVIKYVGHRTSGSNPEQRLESVLSDINARPGKRRGAGSAPEGSNQVDRLYARIVFEAFRQSEPREQKVGKQILATIVLAIRPLQKCGLVDLFATDISESRDVLARVESTLQELSPIIPVVIEANDGLRVCHKTVSDFLLSRQRSTTAMEYVVHKWNRRRSTDHVSDPLAFVINGEEENWNLALACIHLVRRYLTRDINGLAEALQQSSDTLDYACFHWFEHLEHAGARDIPDMKHLANAMANAFGRMNQHRSQWIMLTDEVKVLMQRLRGAAELVCRNISDEHLPNESHQEIVQCTKVLDIARGHFQIALVVHLARDVDSPALDKIAASDNVLRKWLQPSDQTVLDNKCLEGTRNSIISEAKQWLEEPDRPNILWICGAPGSGKSAIATTLVDEFRNMQLCAKVFAKRDFADRRDPMLIWRTLAYDLASLHVGLKGSIMENLYYRQQRSENTVKDQLESRNLIMDVLRQQQYLSVVAVIDALDECFADDHEPWTTLLKTLADCRDSPPSLKLVVTSRDLPDIRRALEDVSYPICLATGADASQEEHSDIQNFLRSKVANTLSTQLSEESLGELTGYAGGSFIWAKMVVELLGTVRDGPVAPQKDILRNIRAVGDIDILYGLLLLATLGPLDEKRRDVMRSFIAALVLARNPLRKSDLVDLADSNQYSLDERRQLVNTMVVNLRSIISVDDEEFLRIPHKSFSDFFLDHDRSFGAMKQLVPSNHDVRSYLVDIEEDSAKLCMACLRWMDNSLKFNACGIKTSYAFNDTLPTELRGRISENVTSFLIYACCFWAEHLKHCNRSDQQFRMLAEPLLKTLLCKNFLYWLEILSLAKSIPSAITSLDIVAGVLGEHGSELAEVAKDGCLFVKMFEEPITASVPHIYLSALPFCPSDSYISRTYKPQYPNLLSVASGRRVSWDVTSSTGDAHSAVVYGVAFFPNRGKLVSGSGDGSVRVWDARTGGALSIPLVAKENNPVYNVAISPDGNRFASGDSLGNLRIWDGNTDACLLGPIKTHNSGVIISVPFSPNGSRISTVGAEDRTVKVWNASTGDLCFELGHSVDAGHTSPLNRAVVRSVDFSLDGSVMWSISSDATIRTWDAQTGEPQIEPLILTVNPYHYVNCFAFSPDGRYLASGSSFGEVGLWDASREFAQLSIVSVENSIFSLSFSPDSKYLVSGCSDGVLHFFSVSSGKCERLGVPIYGHVNSTGVWSVAFAPDGLFVASAGGDSSIKIWAVPTKSTLDTPRVEATTAETQPEIESLDSHGRSVLSDESYIDRDGWMHASRREGSGVLFWVPEENRGGVWWPRNTTVIHRTVTKFDFRKFVHGDSWAECRISESESKVDAV